MNNHNNSKFEIGDLVMTRGRVYGKKREGRITARFGPESMWDYRIDSHGEEFGYREEDLMLIPAST